MCLSSADAMEYLQQTLTEYSGTTLTERRGWYSPAARAYAEVRPPYPPSLIQSVTEAVKLTPDLRILEVGCGPSTATGAFAELGCKMVCLEPNHELFVLAQERCAAYPNVEVHNTTFEEWEGGSGAFDIVLAASSWHFIPADVGCVCLCGLGWVWQAMRSGW